MENRTIKYPKDFFEDIISNIDNCIVNMPYLSFLPLSILIEILGKIKDSNSDWNTNNPRYFFEEGIKCLPLKYHQHTEILYKSLRCGFAHSLLPQKGLGLDERKKATFAHLDYKNERLILIVEDLFLDIKTALLELLQQNYDEDNKMNKPVLYVFD